MIIPKLIRIIILSYFCFGLINAEQAPATLTMYILYELESSPWPNTFISMKATIDSSNSMPIKNVYEGIVEMKQNYYEKKKFEVSISFYLEDIQQPLIFKGIMEIKSELSVEKHEFQDGFLFDKKLLKRNKKGYFLSTTFYTSELMQSLQVIITSQCKSNFFPENVCNKFCMKTRNMKNCDTNGNKICNQGYFLNSDDQQCRTDWCYHSATKCLNGGKCNNMLHTFECQCPPLYKSIKNNFIIKLTFEKGVYCEEYNDLCLKFKCPNGTICSVKEDKIYCLSKLSVSKISPPKEYNNLSVMIIISFAIFIVMIAIGFCVTIWACKSPKNMEFKYSDECGSFKTPPYYNCPKKEQTSFSLHSPSHENISCTCKFNDGHEEWNQGEINNYFSLRYPNGRNPCSYNKSNSDHIIYRSMERQSLPLIQRALSSIQGEDCNNLPLPPPIESENLQNDTLFL